MGRTPQDRTLHRFGQKRPSSDPARATRAPVFPGSPFQTLPSPTGVAPYRLQLADIIPDAVHAMQAAGGLVLHMVGDTGGVLDPKPQLLVAAGLEHDAGVASALGKPAFFYHLGDVIYFDGQAADYYPQFYSPYEHYPNPIIAIPGNHDGDVFDDGKRVNPEPSLAPFMRNFCAAKAGVHTGEAGDAERTAMIQPNCYFSLDTPFATFVGLYTNVPEGGVVEQDQLDWFGSECRMAAADKPLIVALHHPPYSLDTYHSGSAAMLKVLAAGRLASGRTPDLVFAAHVHNYQRFEVTEGGVTTPYIVSGNGGYHNLHTMLRPGGHDIVPPYTPPKQPGETASVVLQSYTDALWGFMRLEITPEVVEVQVYTVPLPQATASAPPKLADRLRWNWRARTIAT